jgi:hypothetical protein
MSPSDFDPPDRCDGEAAPTRGIKPTVLGPPRPDSSRRSPVGPSARQQARLHPTPLSRPVEAVHCLRLQGAVSCQAPSSRVPARRPGCTSRLGSPTTSLGDSRGKARSNAAPVAIGCDGPGSAGWLQCRLRRWSHVSARRIGDSHVAPGWRWWRTVHSFAWRERRRVTTRGRSPIERSLARHRPNSAHPSPDNAERPRVA